MVRKKILFTGGSGLLAINLANQLKNDYDIYLGMHQRFIHLDLTKSINLNLEDENLIEKAILELRPDVLINAAGMTSVEKCEKNPDQALAINSIIPGNLAKISKNLGVKFVHISTDHLYDGTREFSTEEDILCPINQYGRSKALGEELVLKNNTDSLIIRTNFFGWGTSYRNSFSDFIITTLVNRNQLFLFEDVFFTPISTDSLCEFALKLINTNNNGIYNLVSSEKISKYNFGIDLAKCFNLDKKLIQKDLISNRIGLVKRPKDMSLCNKKIQNALSLKIESLEDQIIKLQQSKTFNP